MSTPAPTPSQPPEVSEAPPRATRRLRPSQLAALLAALALLLLAWLPRPQQLAVEHAEAGLKRALATYAVVRGLDASCPWRRAPS